MTATIPDSHKDLLEEPVYVVVTTVMPDGQPQSTVVWASYDGEFIYINTTTARQKARNLRANPKVTVVAIDTNNPYHWLEVRGEVIDTTEEGAVEHITELAKMYAGVEKYYGGFAPAERAKTETRLKVTIKPTKVNAYGH